MTRQTKPAAAPDSEPVPADPVAEAAGKLNRLHTREADLGEEIRLQQEAVTGAGDAMAAEPSPKANEAFQAATSHLTSLQAQQASLRDRLIPAAVAALETAQAAARAQREREIAARFRAAVREKLMPADRRFIEAVDALEEALSLCKEARDAIQADPAFHPYYAPTAPYGGTSFLLAMSALNMAVPMGVARFFSSFQQYPGQVGERPNLLAFHAERFGKCGINRSIGKSL